MLGDKGLPGRAQEGLFRLHRPVGPLLGGGQDEVQRTKGMRQVHRLYRRDEEAEKELIGKVEVFSVACIN